jgi:hypothetical protein
MKPDVHCANIALKTNARAKLISKSFLSRDCHCMSGAFVVYVRPLLYCTPMWSPYSGGDVKILLKINA